MSTSTDASTEQTYWSHSAADKGNRCALWWATRNGPYRGTADKKITLAQARGLVVHDAIAAGLRAAVDDPHPTPGVMLDRYRLPMRVALGKAWEEYSMPADYAEAESVAGMVNYAASAVVVPAAADVAAVEQRRETTTPAGRPFVYIIDYAHWRAGRLVVVDWKTGGDDPDKVRRNAQLSRYGWLLARDLDVDPAVVDIELHNVRKQATRSAPLDIEFAERAVRMVDDVADRMEAYERAGEFPGTTGPHCSRCDLSRTCPALARREIPEAS